MSKSAWFVLLMLLSFWTVVIGLADVFVFGAAAWQFQSRNFARTQGEIQISQVTRRMLVNSGITIEYSYTVNGREYRGSGYRYDDQQSCLQAEDLVRRFPEWSAQTVYYNPNHPADSVLSTGVDGTDLVLMLFATPINVVIFMLWRWMLGRLREIRRATEAGGVRIRRQKGRIRVRLDGVPAGVAGVCALGGASFVAAFPVVVLGGFAPSVHQMVLVWVAVLGAAGLAFCGKAGRNASGRYDLWIDEGARTVTLPRTCGRAESITFPQGEISGVSLQRRVNRLASGSYYSYLPALNRVDARMGPQRERLSAWGWSEEKARGFSQWLCGQLGWDFKGVEDENPEAAV
ncbi:MAG: DUF3592 domain-containing protein [Verrucomicrobiota bacterium]|jgi:hypothetical protein